MTARSLRTRRRATTLIAAAVGALVLSGCQITNPAITMERYAPADGIELDGDVLDVRDLLVISHGDGAPAVVLGSVINSGDEPVTATVSVAGQELTPAVELAPGRSTRLDGTQADGTAGERLVLPALEAPTGQSVEVRISADGQDTLVGNAPVLLPQGHYEQFADDAGGTVEPVHTDDEDH